MRWHKVSFYMEADPPFPVDPLEFLRWFVKQEGLRIADLVITSPETSISEQQPNPQPVVG